MRRMVAVGFLGMSLAMACGIEAQAFKGQTAAPLEKTRWTLTWVEGTKVEGETPKPAFIELDPGTHRLSGSGGCNQLMGTYELEDHHLRLTGTTRTMMACASGMDTEDKLVKALEQVRGWKVSGETLELLDGSGHVVAKFAAGS